MSQEKIDARKNDKRANANKSKKASTGYKVRSVVFYVVLIAVAGGIVWSIVNMVGSYSDSVPNYDPTDCVIYDYASATSTAAEETDSSDLYESLVDSGAISVEDDGSVVVESDATEEGASETTVETTTETSAAE